MTLHHKISTGFPAGTLVHTNKGLVPIQDINVGDLVLSKPESGEGEANYKHILNIFVYKNKELWLVVAQKHSRSKDIQGNRLDREMFFATQDTSEFIATPNHRILVTGMGKMGPGVLDEVIAYPQPQWKRVDQLQQYEVIVNKDGVMFYIEQAQPLSQFKDQELGTVDPTVAWYQRYYYVSQDPSETEDIEYYDFSDGTVIDIQIFKETQHLSSSKFSDKPSVGYYKSNNWKTEQNLYIPFTDKVYNLVVADDYTYFVTKAGI